jgi:hypothetical protein
MTHVLDERKPLRDSILWRLQASFYDRINIRCWSDAIVPNFVTSNAFIANCYARNILAFVRDWFLRCVCLCARSCLRVNVQHLARIVTVACNVLQVCGG